MRHGVMRLSPDLLFVLFGVPEGTVLSGCSLTADGYLTLRLSGAHLPYKREGEVADLVAEVSSRFCLGDDNNEPHHYPGEARLVAW